MMRKLLYHRGIDDSMATFLTDYVTGALCLVLSLLTGIMALVAFRRHRRVTGVPTLPLEAGKSYPTRTARDSKASGLHSVVVTSGDSRVVAVEECNRSQPGKARSTSKKSDHTITKLHLNMSLIFLTCGIMYILGGLTHAKVQEVKTAELDEQHSSLEEILEQMRAYLPCYVLWELANIFGGLSASLIILLVPNTMACEWKMLPEPQHDVRSRSPSAVPSRSRASTNVSTAALVNSSLEGQSASSRCVTSNKTYVRYALLLLCLAVAVSSVTYHMWNVGSYLGTISNQQETLLQDQYAAGISTSSDNSRKAVELTSILRPSQLENSTELPLNTTEGKVFPLSSGDQAVQQGLDLDNMWRMDVTSPTLGMAIFMYACYFTYLTCALLRTGEKSLKEKCCDVCGPPYKDCCGRVDTVIVVNESGEDVTPVKYERPKFSGLFHRISEISLVWLVGLRCVAAWLIFGSGAIQFGLSSQCAGNDAHDRLGCPLPDAFNHNSVYHTGVGIGMVMLFVAETLEFFSKRTVEDKC